MCWVSPIKREGESLNPHIKEIVKVFKLLNLPAGQAVKQHVSWPLSKANCSLAPNFFSQSPRLLESLEFVKYSR